MHDGKSGFLGGMMKLTSAAAIAQIISFALAPVLGRIFPPEAFGSLAIFSSITAILGCLSLLRYGQAIVLPERNEDACCLVAGCFIILGLWSLAVFAATWLFARPVSVWLGWEEGDRMLLLAAPFILLSGIVQIGDAWLTRVGRFGVKGVERVVSALSTGATFLAMGLMGFTTGSTLIRCSFAGPAGSLMVQVRAFWGADWSVLRRMQWPEVKSQLVRYRRFPLYDSGAGLLNVASISLAPLLLAVFFAQDVVGQYSRSMALVQIPMSLLGASVAQVFYHRAAREKETGHLPVFVGKVFLLLVAMGLFPFCFLGLAGKEILTVVLGARWEMAGTFAQIVSPWCLLVFIGSPISTLLFVFHRQDVNLAFNIVSVTLRALGIMAGGWLGSAYLSVGLFSAFGVLLWIVLIAYLLRLAGVRLRTWLRDLLPALGTAAVLTLALGAYRHFATPAAWLVVLVGVAFCAVYIAVVTLARREFRDILREFIGSRVPAGSVREEK